MVSKFFQINIGELSLAFMNCHRIVESNKVLVLNVGDCGVAYKVMLCNVLHTDGCGVSGKLVLGFVYFILVQGIRNGLTRWHSTGRSGLHSTLQVNVSQFHLLTLGSKTFFASHCLKYTQLVFGSGYFFVLGDGFTHWRHHNNAVFVQKCILRPVADDLIRIILAIEHIFNHFSRLIRLFAINFAESFKLKVHFAIRHQAFSNNCRCIVNTRRHNWVNIVNSTDWLGGVANRNVEIMVIRESIEGILGLRQSQVINHLEIHLMCNLEFNSFVAFRSFDVRDDQILFVEHFVS